MTACGKYRCPQNSNRKRVYAGGGEHCSQTLDICIISMKTLLPLRWRWIELLTLFCQTTDTTTKELLRFPGEQNIAMWDSRDGTKDVATAITKNEPSSEKHSLTDYFTLKVSFRFRSNSVFYASDPCCFPGTTMPSWILVNPERKLWCFMAKLSSFHTQNSISLNRAIEKRV